MVGCISKWISFWCFICPIKFLGYISLGYFQFLTQFIFVLYCWLFSPSFSVSHPIYFCALLLAIFYQERMASAKLIASLMASEDVIVKSISGGLLEARSVLSRVSFSDSSPELQQICQQLLACITSP
jgi:hypothetical protein